MTQINGAAAVEAAAAPPPTTHRTIVEVRALDKRFGPTIALDRVDLTLARGQVHGLVGANGAGKSTLIRILSGALRPDSGAVLIDGVPLQLGDPTAARSAGLIAVQQDIDAGLLPGRSVAQNLALDLLADRGAGTFLSDAGIRRAARRIAGDSGLGLDLDASIDRLGAGDRQQIVLARALAQRPRLLILDEPTSALSERETGPLFRAIQRMVSAGVAVLYVSHRLGEVAALADTVHVLRGGRTVASMRRPFSGPAIGEAILGHAPVSARRPDPPLRKERDGPTDGPGGIVEPLLRLQGVATRAGMPRVDLDVAGGEVVGLFGLIGAGKTSLFEGLFGVRSFAAGSVRLDGRPHAPRDPAAAILAGVHLVPEDRARHALLPTWSVARNLSLPFLARTQRFGFLDRRSERRRALSTIGRFGIVAAGPDAEVRTLSGGNQQKVVVGRWLTPDARLLLLDEPFAGIDLGARADIGRRLRDSAADRSTIVASSDIDELLEVADRIVVLASGAIVHDGAAGSISREAYVGLAARVGVEA